LGVRGGRTIAHFYVYFSEPNEIDSLPQYLILGTLVVTSFVQYLLHVFERRRAAPWTEKPLYAALIDLGLGTFTFRPPSQRLVIDAIPYCPSELLRSAIYIGYFALMLHYYGLPLHMLRPMWTSSRTVALRSMELWRFRRATVNMNTRYSTYCNSDVKLRYWVI
jgi:E3 ubiquitin-protein ligase synoviolin